MEPKKLGEIAFPKQARDFVALAVESLPSNRKSPPEDEEVAYAQLIGPGAELNDGVRVVLKPGDPGEIEAIQPFIASLSAEWLAVAVRGLDEAHVFEILLELTLSPRWSGSNVFVVRTDDQKQALSAPYCEQRMALMKFMLGGMLKRESDIPGFLQRLATNIPFVTAVQSCAGDAENGPLLTFWLEVSGTFAARATDGHLVRRLHPVIFQDNMLAIEAARVGNLAVLRGLDSDGYDVRGKVGGGCCGGGRAPIDVARSNSHTECVTFLDELKLYPPVLRYDPKKDQA